MALKHKSKLCVSRELKQEFGFEDYLECIKETPSKLFFKILFEYPWAV